MIKEEENRKTEKGIEDGRERERERAVCSYKKDKQV